MTRQSATQLEPVKAPSAAGWLSPAEAAQLLTETFGRRLGTRTVQLWCHRSERPLPHVVLGGRLLIHRNDLLGWLDRGGTITQAGASPGGPHPSSVTNGGSNGE